MTEEQITKLKGDIVAILTKGSPVEVTADEIIELVKEATEPKTE